MGLFSWLFTSSKSDKIPPLVRKLQNGNADVRFKAIVSLSQIADERAIEPTVAALEKDESSVVRATAAKALGSLIVEVLMKSVVDQGYLPEDRRAVLANSLERVVTALVKALQDSGFLVRNEATKALGKIGDKRAIGPLQAAMGRGEEDLRKLASEALQAIQSADEWLQALDAKRAPSAKPSPAPAARDTATAGLIDLTCPQCGKKLRAKTALAGKKVKCPQCQRPVSVPQVQPGRAPATSAKTTADFIHDLQHGNADTAISAGHELGKLGEPALNEILQAVGDEDIRKRLNQLKAGGKWRTGDAGLLILELTRRVLRPRGFES